MKIFESINKNYEISIDKEIQERYIKEICHKLSYLYKDIQKKQTSKQSNINKKLLQKYQNQIALCKDNCLIHKDFLYKLAIENKETKNVKK